MPTSILIAILLLVAVVGSPAEAAGPGTKHLRDAGTKLLEEWVSAQNIRDTDKYFGFYDAKAFKGIKRTRDGKAVSMDFPAWKADRARLLSRNPTVLAERAETTTWLDPGSKLEKGTLLVRFVQRWRTPSYADHGIKVLQLRRQGDGQWRIIYEDLLNSDPGWGSLEAMQGLAALGLAIKSDADALAYWKKLPFDGDNWWQIQDNLPAGPGIHRFLARALIKGKNFGCDMTAEKREGGEDVLVWADLPEGVTFDDPCLRVRLVHWAVEADRLTAADRLELAPILRSLLALPRPAHDLQRTLLAKASALPEPVRLEWLKVAVEADGRELANDALDGLSAPALAKVYRAWKLDRAAAGLDVNQHLDLALQAAANGKLTNETRLDLLTKLGAVPGAQVTAALHAIAETFVCNLRMRAFSLLTKRGETGLLPAKPKSAKDDWVFPLCLILNDDDKDRQAALLAPFLPEGKNVSVMEQANYGRTITDEGVADDVSVLNRGKLARGQHLPEYLSGGLQHGMCELEENQREMFCSFNDDETWIWLGRKNKRGEFFITRMGKTHDRECPCQK